MKTLYSHNKDDLESHSKAMEARTIHIRNIVDQGLLQLWRSSVDHVAHLQSKCICYYNWNQMSSKISKLMKDVLSKLEVLRL